MTLVAWSRHHILLALAMLLASSTARTGYTHDLTFTEVKGLAREAVQSKQIEFSLPHIQQSGDTVYFTQALAHMPIRMPIDRVILTQLHLEVMRTAYGDTLNQDFWESLVGQAEDTVKNRMLRVAYSGRMNKAQRFAELDRLDQQIDAIFEGALRAYESPRGLRVQAEYPHGAYAVVVRTDPGGGKVYILHLVQWIRLQKEGKNPAEHMDLVPNGSQVTWSGTHVIRVEFRNRTVAPETIELHEGGTLVIDKSGAYRLVQDQ